MDNYLYEACESIDAVIFSGDCMYDESNRQELREYMSRWERGIKQFESLESEEV